MKGSFGPSKERITEAMIGVFPDEGFTAKASVGAGLFGGGFIFRIHVRKLLFRFHPKKDGQVFRICFGD